MKKMTKDIWARETARNEAIFWERENRMKCNKGEPEYSLEYMFSFVVRKGFEAGRRYEAKKIKG